MEFNFSLSVKLLAGISSHRKSRHDVVVVVVTENIRRGYGRLILHSPTAKHIEYLQAKQRRDRQNCEKIACKTKARTQ